MVMAEMKCRAVDAMMPDAPPSIAKVICTLENQAPLTNKQIQDATGLPRRTLYTALKRLQEEGLVEHQVSLRDTRQTYFWLNWPGAAAS